MSPTIHFLETVDSTNDEARRLLKNNQDFKDHIIIAESQTKGRGRLGRRWYSPPGNLYMTILKTPKISLAELSKISLIVGLSLHRVLKKYIPENHHLCLKWPNDILVNRNKLGGILVETESYSIIDDHMNDSLTCCLIGVGINLVSSPELSNYSSCNLLEFTKDVPQPDVLALEISQSLDDLIETWETKGFDSLREEWLWNAYGLGKPVSAKAENGFQIYGRFLTINKDGAVVIMDETQQEHLITSSEITYMF